MKRAVRQFVCVLPAALLGFTCLALLSFPTESPQAYDGHTSTGPYLRFFTPTQVEGLVKWERLGGWEEEENSSTTTVKYKNQPFLDNVPHFFQEKLLRGLPYLFSHPGPEGLFRRKYSRLLQLLIDYTTLHDQLHGNTTSRTLTWWCSIHSYCGGLGDRVRGVAYALLLAIFSRRRLVIYWEDQPEGQYLAPHMINWQDKALYDFLRLIDGNNNAPPLQDNFLDPFLCQFQVILDNGKLKNDVDFTDMAYYQRVIGSNTTHVVVSTNLEPSSLLDPQRYGDQEWIRAGMRWSNLAHLTATELDNIVGLVFRYLFTVPDKLWAEVYFASEVLGLRPPRPYVALHLRTGFAGMGSQEELARHPKLEHSVSVWNSSLDCAVHTADAYLGVHSPVFLATDSDLVKDIALAKYGARIHTLKSPLVHLDKFSRDPPVELSVREKEGVLVVWVEFLLLAQAEILVRGESGYSWIAGLVSGMHGNRTVSTKHCTPIWQ